MADSTGTQAVRAPPPPGLSLPPGVPLPPAALGVPVREEPAESHAGSRGGADQLLSHLQRLLELSSSERQATLEKLGDFMDSCSPHAIDRGTATKQGRVRQMSAASTQAGSDRTCGLDSDLSSRSSVYDMPGSPYGHFFAQPLAADPRCPAFLAVRSAGGTQGAYLADRGGPMKVATRKVNRFGGDRCRDRAIQ